MWYIVIIALLIVIVMLCVVVIYHDTHNFTVRRYEITSDKVDRDYSFVLITDLHGYVFGRNNDSLIDAIDDEKPDAILCAGDMFNGKRNDKGIDVEPGFSLLSRLAEKYPVYVSNGNHEEKVKLYTQSYGNFFERYKNRLMRKGVCYLENESAYFDEGKIRISGLELGLEFFTKFKKVKMEQGYMEKKLGQISSSDKDKLQILIAHNPVYFEEYAKWGADITVSGHIHGGIIRLPLIGGVISPAIVLFPKYDGGLYKKGDKTMVLGRGLGTHTIHVRMFNPGEVAVIRVKGR